MALNSTQTMFAFALKLLLGETPVNAGTILPKHFSIPVKHVSIPANGFGIPANNFIAPVKGFAVPVDGVAIPVNRFTVPANAFFIPVNNFMAPVNNFAAFLNTFLPTASWGMLPVNVFAVRARCHAEPVEASAWQPLNKMNNLKTSNL
jgi:hypothetical protein